MSVLIYIPLLPTIYINKVPENTIIIQQEYLQNKQSLILYYFP